MGQKFKKSDQLNFFTSVQREFQLTGTVSIMIDEKYTLQERDFIQKLYEQTGIDLRVVQSDDILEFIKDKPYFDKFDDVVNFLTERYSIDEMKMHRKMSNQFREDRLNQIKQKGFENVK